MVSESVPKELNIDGGEDPQNGNIQSRCSVGERCEFPVDGFFPRNGNGLARNRTIGKLFINANH